jgi:hypothetical protein
MDVTKFLLEFHGAEATRETLKESLSTGSFELVKMMRERLRDADLRERVDVLEVAAEFHQLDMLTWLLRDATIFERELLVAFALEERLADALVAAFEDGFRPWWSRTHEAALK